MSRPKPSPTVSSADPSLTSYEQARYTLLMLKIDSYLNKSGDAPTEADFVEWQGLLTKKIDIRKNSSAPEFGALEEALAMPQERTLRSIHA